MYYDKQGDMRITITGGTPEERKTLGEVIYRSLADLGMMGVSTLNERGQGGVLPAPDESVTLFDLMAKYRPRLLEADIGIDTAQDPNWQPQQPFELDPRNVLRYRGNALVRHLVDHGSIDLNTLAMVAAPLQDQQQFNQLIGYSVSGFGDLQCSPYSQDQRDAEGGGMYGELPKLLDDKYKAGQRGVVFGKE